MISRLGWMIHKDLVVEIRSFQAWPTMLVLGVIIAVTFSMQIEVSPANRPDVFGALLWLGVLFAGLIAVDRSNAMEHEDGCWEGLLLYPLPSSLVFVAKLVVNFIALLALACMLTPLFVVLIDLRVSRDFLLLPLVAVLACASIAAIGTLVSAVTRGSRQRSAILSVLVLPLLLPVVIAASESTRLIAEGNMGSAGWRWVQFLGAFATIYITLGIAIYGTLMEDG